MNSETREFLEDFQEELREKADKEEISYANDSIYGMVILLDSALNDDLTVQEAVAEFIANSYLEIQVDAVETSVVHR